MTLRGPVSALGHRGGRVGSVSRRDLRPAPESGLQKPGESCGSLPVPSSAHRNLHDSGARAPRKTTSKTAVFSAELAGHRAITNRKEWDMTPKTVVGQGNRFHLIHYWVESTWSAGAYPLPPTLARCRIPSGQYQIGALSFAVSGMIRTAALLVALQCGESFVPPQLAAVRGGLTQGVSPSLRMGAFYAPFARHCPSSFSLPTVRRLRASRHTVAMECDKTEPEVKKTAVAEPEWYSSRRRCAHGIDIQPTALRMRTCTRSPGYLDCMA